MEVIPWFFVFGIAFIARFHINDCVAVKDGLELFVEWAAGCRFPGSEPKLFAAEVPEALIEPLALTNQTCLPSVAGVGELELLKP